MKEKMVELVEFIVKQFAEDKDQVTVTAEDRDGAVNIVVTASESDMGRIIGKQGRIAKSIRTIVKSVSAKESQKYFVEIRDRKDASAPAGGEQPDEE